MHLRMYTLSCRYFIVRGRLHVSRCVYICMYAYGVCPELIIPKQVKLMGSLVSLGYALNQTYEVVHVNQVK